MANNQDQQIMHVTNECDRLEASKRLSGNQLASMAAVQDWGNLIRTPEDGRSVMTLLHKRYLAFDGPENQ